MLFTAIAVITFSYSAEAMIFKSNKVAAQWDTWAYYHEGTYYLYYLITEYSPGEGFGVATSTDGVHWADHGWALRQSKKNNFYLGTGSVWKSPDFDQTGKFICNYSEHRNDASGKRTQNILFAWSKDLLNWTKFDDSTMFKVDTQYYARYGRWDCIFAFPRDEGGYWGTWTATGKTIKGTVGIGYSEDGVTWKALPAPTVQPGVGESGAIYPIKGRIHAMFGAGGGMWAYSSDNISGPYKRAAKNAHLLDRGHTYFSRFLPTPDGLLVNHHQMSGIKLEVDGQAIGRRRDVTYVSPFKRAEVDRKGIMRWKYWQGNEKLKGKVLDVLPASSDGTSNITAALDFNKGIIAEALVTLPRENSRPVSLFFSVADRHYALRILHNGAVEMGTVDAFGKNWKKVHGANREWRFGPTVSLRILLRAGMMEVYLDDHFVECWTMGCHGAKMVTLGMVNEGTIKNIKLWEMSLKPTKAPEIAEPLKTTVTASSIYDSRYAAEYAADGDTRSRWCSSRPYGKSEWLQFDLGSEQDISRVIIDWEVAYAKTYELQISSDGNRWRTLCRITEGNGGRDVIDNLNAAGRYLRLNLEKRETEHGYSIYEVQVMK